MSKEFKLQFYTKFPPRLTWRHMLPLGTRVDILHRAFVELAAAKTGLSAS